ncbi:MAG TPA: carbohydrate ABC transporter permease [Aggregatilineales bacterium]|nr:carbohydrate ABC transporter permease [Aggregatilineales bacterium]
MSAINQTAASGTRAATGILPLAVKRFLGWFALRATLIILCLIWTIPTFGLLISSLRDKDQLAVSGWWSSLSSTNSTDQGRTGTFAEQVEENGMFVIRGDTFEEGDHRQIETFGLTATGTADFEVGDTVETNDGYAFTVDKDGHYELRSATEFPEDFDRGQRFVFEAATPPRFSLENYDTVLDSAGIGDAFVDTVIVTIPSTVFPIAIAAFAAYAFSWMSFPFRILLLTMVVAMIVVPLQLSLIPILKIYNQLDLRGTYLGLWLAHTAFGLPLAVYLLHNYISTLPRDIIESGQIDGASHFDIFVRLILPLSVPALAAFTIFQFLWVWNDLLVALVFLGSTSGNSVLTMAIRDLNGSRGEEWHIMTAAAFVSMFVPLVVFFSLQRYFVRGLTAGSVKG